MHAHMHTQAQDSLELLKKEQLQLEHEVVLLRRVSQPSPFDRERHELVMEDLQEQLEDRDTRIKELEDFIIEQDEVMPFENMYIYNCRYNIFSGIS